MKKDFVIYHWRKTEMNTQDLRYIKTEDLIIEAFLSCAAEYDIQDIHIKDICSRARISRNAFYSHYENKYQVLEAICRQTEERMIQALKPEIIRNLSNNFMYSTTEWCIRMICENRDFFRVLARCSETSLHDMIHRIFILETLNALYDNIEEIEKDPILKMSEAFITDSLTSSIMIWLKDPDPISREEFTAYLHEISHEAVGVFYRKLDESKVITRKQEFQT